MNTSFRKLWRHMTVDYYHEILRWNIHLRFCLIAAPLTISFIKDYGLCQPIKIHVLKRQLMKVLNLLMKVIISLFFGESRRWIS